MNRTSIPSKVTGLRSAPDVRLARKLVRLHSRSHTGLRHLAAFGLFAWELKETFLPHGQWGQWLAAHAPVLSRRDSITGQPMPGHPLIAGMELARHVLVAVGFSTVESYFQAAARFPRSAEFAGSHFLSLPEHQIPQRLRSLHRRMCALVAVPHRPLKPIARAAARGRKKAPIIST